MLSLQCCDPNVARVVIRLPIDKLLCRRSCLDEFRINGQLNLVAYHTLRTGHSEIGSIESSACRDAHVQVPAPIIDRFRRAFYIENDGFSDSPDCEVTSNLQLVSSNGLKLRGAKRHARVLLNIKEMVAAQIVISHFDPCINGRRLNRYLNGVVLGVCSIIVRSAAQFRERPPYSRNSHMPNRKLRR